MARVSCFVVGQLIATPMPELMRVHGESQLRTFARLGNHLAYAGIGQRPFALGEKDVVASLYGADNISRPSHQLPV
jgi:hypothetical protein